MNRGHIFRFVWYFGLISGTLIISIAGFGSLLQALGLETGAAYILAGAVGFLAGTVGAAVLLQWLAVRIEWLNALPKEMASSD
jgi:hypothetical protein